MASIRREITIDAAADHVWDALRDFGRLHEFAPGFVLDTRLDGGDRIVTFASGAVLREVLVDLDEDTRRLAWTIVDGPYSHHNGSAQVFDAEGETRLQWVTDLLPDALAAPTAEMMDAGLRAIKSNLENVSAATGSRP